MADKGSIPCVNVTKCLLVVSGFIIWEANAPTPLHCGLGELDPSMEI